MFGISVYLSGNTISEQEPYIQKMKELGCKSIFTSLHIPEEDPKTYKERLQELGNLSKKFDMDLIADVSPVSLQHLELTWDKVHQLKEWGLTGLRVDYGVNETVIAQLSKQMTVALNASTLTHENTIELRNEGADFSNLEAWHNYYPRSETGLDREEFNGKNRWLKTEGFTVMAFVPGDGVKRGPIYEGLPTIEDHRGRSTFSAFLDFVHDPWVDKIFIGDPTINASSTLKFKAYQNDVILLRAKWHGFDVQIKEFLTNTQTNRFDSARDVIRSTESRQMAQVGELPVHPANTTARPLGTITIDNEKYGRYQGEIQIVKRSLPHDKKVNVIGHVVEEDRMLLRFIKGGSKYQIKWI